MSNNEKNEFNKLDDKFNIVSGNVTWWEEGMIMCIIRVLP